MRPMQRVFAFFSLTTILAIPALAQGPVWGQRDGLKTRSPKSEALNPAAKYARSQVEHYLTEEQVGFIRPGLNLVIESVDIAADGTVSVVVVFFDDFDQPLDREGKVTPGPVSMSFILSRYDGTLRQHTAYTTRDQTSPITGVTETQASTDRGGTFEDLGLGRVRYTYATKLPPGFNPAQTHTVAIYANRDLRDIIEKRYVANVIHDFRPDGGPVTERWNAFTVDTCNACHHDLGLHGGVRKLPKLCVNCHNPQSVDPDTGNTVNFKVMIHKIHRGENLPSVQAGIPYQIIGFRQSVHDYSTVALPQDIRNCTTCHRPESPEGDIWFTRPSRAACGSCHDDVNFETGENHPGGVQLDDTACASCHVPEGDEEFDASIKLAHTIPTESRQLAGLNIEIVDVEDTAPGSQPTVTFRVFNDDGSLVDPATLSSFNFLVGGPTTDYEELFRESGLGATVIGDLAFYTFETPMPPGAMGSWTLSADVRRSVTIDDGSEEGIEVREAAQNPIFHFAVTDAVPQPRRDVVAIDNCNVCHKKLAMHGGQRFQTRECVICHNANNNDGAVRPVEELPVESIHFKRLIHRLHTGEELTQDFTVFGFRGSRHNYNELRFPGDRRYCEACHLEGTYGVPLPEGVLPTSTPRDWYTPMQPIAAACLACHDTVAAAAHAFVMTAPFGEACAACHGEEREFAVEMVHAH